MRDLTTALCAVAALIACEAPRQQQSEPAPPKSAQQVPAEAPATPVAAPNKVVLNHMQCSTKGQVLSCAVALETNKRSLSGIQARISFDSNMLAFKSLSCPDKANNVDLCKSAGVTKTGHSITTRASTRKQGQMALIAYHPSQPGLALSTDAPIAMLLFDVKQKQAQKLSVQIADAVGTDADANKIGLKSVNGRLAIKP